MADIPDVSDPVVTPEIEIEVAAPTAASDEPAPDGPGFAVLKAKIELLSAQLEESFARARDTLPKSSATSAMSCRCGS